MIGAIHNALSGLFAASRRVEVSAANVANMQTGGSLEPGGKAPYSAQTTVQETAAGGGVKAYNIPKNPAFVPAYDPDSPFANSEGIIGTPNVDLAEEAVNLTLAETAYKANIKVIQAAADMQDELLESFDRRV